MSEYQLNKWGVTLLQSHEFLAPECMVKCLTGFRDKEDCSVRTSAIAEVNGRIITTASGSTYFLGEPSPEYLEYLESIGYEYDIDNPIKDHRHDS